jgi:Putative transposase.
MAVPLSMCSGGMRRVSCVLRVLDRVGPTRCLRWRACRRSHRRRAGRGAHPCAALVRAPWPVPPEAVADMREGTHGGGFSLDAKIRIEATDRPGLRYCARPIFAGRRLEWTEKGERLVYRLPRSRPDGQTVLHLTPLEWLNRLAPLIPLPRRHRHCYHGVLAPNAPQQSR